MTLTFFELACQSEKIFDNRFSSVNSAEVIFQILHVTASQSMGNEKFDKRVYVKHRDRIQQKYPAGDASLHKAAST
jgi:hypothetical protein